MKRAERTGRNVQHMKKANASRFRRQFFVFVFVYSLLLVSGFFLFANQHFASMDYVMKNSSLRKQIDELEREKRRLILAREMCQSPVEIKKAAKRAGLFEMDREKLETTRIMAELNEKDAAPNKKGADSFIVKTSSVRSIPSASNNRSSKIDRSESADLTLAKRRRGESGK